MARPLRAALQLASRWTCPAGAGRRRRGRLAGVVLANELVDALPVHRLVRRGGRPAREPGSPGAMAGSRRSTRRHRRRRSAEHLAADGVTLAEGQLAEVGLARRRVDGARRPRTCRRGQLLVIDYGHDAAELYGPRRMAGTLRDLPRPSGRRRPVRGRRSPGHHGARRPHGARAGRAPRPASRQLRRDHARRASSPTSAWASCSSTWDATRPRTRRPISTREPRGAPARPASPGRFGGIGVAATATEAADGGPLPAAAGFGRPSVDALRGGPARASNDCREPLPRGRASSTPCTLRAELRRVPDATPRAASADRATRPRSCSSTPDAAGGGAPRAHRAARRATCPCRARWPAGRQARAGRDFPAGTALREAAEEVGLDARRRRAGVGGSDVVDVRVSGFLRSRCSRSPRREPRLVPAPARGGRHPRVPRAAASCRARLSRSSRRSGTAFTCATAPTRRGPPRLGRDGPGPGPARACWVAEWTRRPESARG